MAEDEVKLANLEVVEVEETGVTAKAAGEAEVAGETDVVGEVVVTLVRGCDCCCR